ncbi:MAG: hypothetical protein NXH75_11335, partial [Halobacteriovoraceae bacterium]|nr:hypothetical protein [Halobacteriovoraceae bacterium]
DLEKGIRKFYSSKRLLDERPSLSLDSCEGLARAKKFVMLGLGIENLVLTNDVMGFNFTPQEETIECKLKNNPFSLPETSTDRFAKSRKKREFFNRCVVMQVTEFNEKVDLRYPEKQPGCNIQKVSKWSADFSGSYCFLKPYEKSNISVHLDVRPECLNKDILGQKKTILSDYNALLNTYIAGDATGFSPDLTAVSTTPVRISMTPPKGLLNLSEDFGGERPRWPTTWKAADLFFGEIEIREMDSLYDEIKVPLVANTICERKCQGNLCTSPCDFSQPIVGEFTIYELIDGKREFLQLWHDGSVASAGYQGILHGMGTTIQKGVLEEGKTYEIEGIFREPELDFSYFSGRVKRELRFRRNYIGPLARTGQINLVPQISTIGRTGVVPEVPVIRNLSFENSHLDGLSRALSTWQSKLNNAFWPPFYESMCSTETSNCEKSGEGFVTLKTRFTLNKKDNGDWNLNLIKGERSSNIVSNRTWSQDEVPSIDCGFNDEDEDDFDWGDIL